MVNTDFSVQPPSNTGLVVFTDGSKTTHGLNAGTASAAVLYDYSNSNTPIGYKSGKLQIKCSVFQAEIYAILLATDMIFDYLNTNCANSVHIYCDSQAAL